MVVPAEIGPVELSPQLADKLQAWLDKGEVSFEVTPHPLPKPGKGKPVKKSVALTKEKIKLR